MPSSFLLRARANSFSSSLSLISSTGVCRLVAGPSLNPSCQRCESASAASEESPLQPCSRRAHLFPSLPLSRRSQIAPTPSNRRPRPTRILLISDPQLIHFQSPSFQRKPWKTAITEFVVDTFLKKSWSVAKQFKPDAVFFLGDQLDSGRATMSDAE